MSSSDVSRVKSRNRNFKSDMIKSAFTPKNGPSFITMCAFPSQRNEADLLLSSLYPKNKNSKQSIPTTTLSSSYRPLVGKKYSGNQRRLKSSCTSDPASCRKTHVANHLVFSESFNPCKSLNHLADYVKSLALYDSSREILSGSIVEDNASTHNLSPSASKFDLPKSPWYRRCRPSAPVPQITPDSTPPSNSDCSPLLRTECNSTCGCFDLSTCEPPSGRCATCDRFDNLENILSTSEPHSDQENIDLSEFPLPPPPVHNDAEHLSDSTFDEFPSPPPLTSEVTQSVITNLGSDKLEKIDDLTSPLMPITNILTNSPSWKARVPKWSVQAVTTSNVRQTTDDYDTSMSSLPSPPPRIVEHIPRHGSTDPSPTESKHLNSTLSGLVRPTVLKRGAPDGAEQKPEEAESAKKLSSTMTIKRCTYSESITPDCSPKKCRTQLLVPSEHSAFLPVISAQSNGRVQLVSSPYIQ